MFKDKNIIRSIFIIVIALSILLLTPLMVTDEYKEVTDLYSMERSDFGKGGHFKGEISYVYDLFMEETLYNSVQSEYYLVELDNGDFVVVEFSDGASMYDAEKLLEYTLYIEGYTEKSLYTNQEDVTFDYEGFFIPLDDETRAIYYEYFSGYGISETALDAMLVPFILTSNYTSITQTNVTIGIVLFVIGSIYFAISFAKYKKEEDGEHETKLDQNENYIKMN